MPNEVRFCCLSQFWVFLYNGQKMSFAFSSCTTFTHVQLPMTLALAGTFLLSVCMSWLFLNSVARAWCYARASFHLWHASVNNNCAFPRMLFHWNQEKGKSLAGHSFLALTCWVRAVLRFVRHWSVFKVEIGQVTYCTSYVLSALLLLPSHHE